MASPDDWNKVGLDGNPVSGNPDVLDGIANELWDLRDVARDVDAGLDVLLRSSESGGFEGSTADGMRDYVKKELKTFTANVALSFEQAGNAVARYALSLRRARDRAEDAARRAGQVAIPPAGLVGKNAPPPAELTAAKNDVEAEVDFVTAEAKIMEEALHDAASLVSRPVKKVKKTFWQKFWHALEIIGVVLAVVGVIFGGWIALAAFAVGAVLFFKAVADYAAGKGNGLSLALAFLGIMFPSTKGLTTASGLLRVLGAGGKALLGGGARAASAMTRTVLQGSRMLFSAPGNFARMSAQNLLGAARWTGNLVSVLPGAIRTGWQVSRDVARGTWKQFTGGLGRDFARSTSFVGGSRALRLSVFAMVALPRFMANTFLPLRYFEISKFGWRGAFRMGILERGLHMRPTVGQSLTRIGGGLGNAPSLRPKDPFASGSGRPFGDVTTPRLVVPGTQAWNDAIDDLGEFLPPGAPASWSGVSSLPPRTPGGMRGGMPDGTFGRIPAAPDDLLEPVSFNGLDPAMANWGSSVFPMRSLDTLGTYRGGSLPFPLFRTVDNLDQLGRPVVPGRGPLLSADPDSAVVRLRELDTALDLERTGTGLLKPIDDLSELMSLSVDGKLGGLTPEQLVKVLDGEVDLVNVTPEGVVLRIGKTDPVDVLVGGRDEVTIRVLEPPQGGTLPPTFLSRMAGPDSPTRMGISLDDLARLIPDTTDGMREARQLLGLGPARNDLTVQPVTPQPGFQPLTLREIVTGGAVGKTAGERFQAWVRVQNAELDLDTAGRALTRLTELPDTPPLRLAQAELDLSGAELRLNQARMDFGRLGMDPDVVRQNISVMTVRLEGPVANLPTGELPLLDSLGQPTGRWITVESGETPTWVLRTDAGVVPGTTVRMADDGFVVTTPEGVFKVGPDGTPVPDVGRLLGDLGRFDGVRLSGSGELTGLGLRVTQLSATDLVPVAFRIDVTDFTAAGGPVRLPDLAVAVREGGGFTVAGPPSGVRLQFDGAGVLEFREFRVPGTDLSLRFGDDVMSGLPQVVGADGLPFTGAQGMDFVRTADGGLTVRVPMTDAPGAAAAEFRFGLRGALIGRDVPLTGHGMDVLSGMSLRLGFDTGIAGTVVSRDLVGGGFGTRLLFRIDATPSSLTGRLGEGATLTESFSGRVFHFDSAGQLRLRDLPDGQGGFLRFEGTSETPSLRLDTSGTPVERLSVSGLDDAGAVGDFRPVDFGGAPQTRFPLDGIPEQILPGDALAERFPLAAIPEESLREVSLSAPGLEGVRLRFTEAPGGEVLPDVAHWELADSAGLSMADRLVLEQLDDGAFTVVDPVRNARWELDPQLQPLSLEVGLPGTERSLRFDLAGDQLPTVVGRGTVSPADGFVVEPLRGGSGELTGVTVRMPDTPGARGPLPEWRFDNAGLLREARLPLTGPGADPALRGLTVRVVHRPATELGAGGRTFELIGSSRTTGAFTVAPLTGEAAQRLPGGFSLTDSVTGLRWNADSAGRIDLAASVAEDGLRVERLGDLDALDDLDTLGSVADRLSTESPHVGPLTQVPDGGLGPLPDLERIFQGTLREGAALRPEPVPTALTSALVGGRTDLSSVRGLDEFFHTVDEVAHDPRTAPGVLQVERLATEAQDVLRTGGFDTRLLHGDLRGLRSSALARVTGDARQALDAHLGSLSGDTRAAGAVGPDGRPFDVDFTVTPGWGGGHSVVHDLTGLRMEFDAQRGLVSREFFLHDAPTDLAGLKLAASDSMTGEGLLIREFTVVDPAGAVDRFVAEPVGSALEQTGARFSVLDRVTGNRFHFALEGTMIAGDVQLGRTLGVLRLDMSAAGRPPRVLDTAGAPVSSLRADTLGGGRVALTPVGESLTRPLQRVVIDSHSLGVTEKIIGVPGPRGDLFGQYWKVDYTSGTAVRLDEAGRELTGRLDTATVRMTPSGEIALVGSDGRILYESLGPGRTVAAVDRTVDLENLRPAEPVWRATDEPLWRYDDRAPEAIHTEGFRPKNPSFLDLGQYVRANSPSGFVSTTADSALSWGSRYKYEIDAPGGIDVNKTFDKDPVLSRGGNPFANEAEISFAGGVQPRFVKGAEVMSGAERGVWKPNPAFRPEGAEQEWTRQATYFFKAMNQTPAPMATTHTVNPGATVHSVVQVVEQPLHGAPELTAGMKLRMTQGPAADGAAHAPHVELLGPDGLRPQGWSVVSHNEGFTVTDPTGQTHWNFDSQLQPLADDLPLGGQGLPDEDDLLTFDFEADLPFPAAGDELAQLDDLLLPDPTPNGHGLPDDPFHQLPDEDDLFTFDFEVDLPSPAAGDELAQLDNVLLPDPTLNGHGALNDPLPSIPEDDELFAFDLPAAGLSPTAGPSRPLAEGWSIVQHQGGGFTVFDPSGQRLWNLDGQLQVLSQHVQVPGTQYLVSFDFTGQHSPTVLGPDGLPASGWSVMEHQGNFAVLDPTGHIRWTIEPHMVETPDPNALLANGATLADDVPLPGVPGDPLLHGHSVLAHYPPGLGPGPAVSRFEILGPAADRFLVGPVDAALEQLGARFSVLSRDTNNLFHFGAGGSPVGVDVWLGQDMGILRLPLDGSGRAPEVLTSMGTPTAAMRAQEFPGGQVAVLPVGRQLTRPLQHVVIDPHSLEVLEKTVGIPARFGDRQGRYWRVDFTSRTAVTLDEAGFELPSGFDPVRVDVEPNGEFSLLGANDGVLYASSGPGRLLAAIDPVDLGTLAPERIVWRKTDETLWRNDNRGPETIFNEGFRPRDPAFLDLDEYVRANTHSAFVSTTIDSNLGWNSKFRYEIHAPGGIDANESFRANNAANPFANEVEISFPGGVHPRFIRRVEELQEGQAIGQLDNPAFQSMVGDEVSRRTATYFIRAMDQTPAPMTVTHTMRLEDATGTVLPVVHVTEEPLVGAPDLAGMRFRLTEMPQTGTSTAFSRMELLGQDGLPVPDRTLLPREGGGFTVSGGPRGDLHFGPGGAFEFRDVRLGGIDHTLRFDTPSGVDGMPKLLGKEGAPVEGVQIRRAGDGGLTVDVRVPWQEDTRLRWRFAENGEPAGQSVIVPDRLAAAVDRSVDVDSITPKDLVAWRDSYETLWRYDDRPPKVIFKEGFAPRNPEHVDLKQLVEFNRHSAFVSTTFSADAKFARGTFRYEIYAPGGIDAGETLRDVHIGDGVGNPHEGEFEISFPGGIRPQFIKGAHKVVDPDGAHTLTRWKANRGFDPTAVNTEVVRPIASQDVQRILSDAAAKAPVSKPVQVPEELERFARAFGKMTAFEAGKLWDDASGIISQFDAFPLRIDGERAALLKRDPLQYWHTMRVAQELHLHAGRSQKLLRGIDVARDLAAERGVDGVPRGLVGGSPGPAHLPGSSGGAGPSGERTALDGPAVQTSAPAA
ncbi:scabin-related ADP-ribosyltransferase, partial [Streptomyces spongiae]